MALGMLGACGPQGASPDPAAQKVGTPVPANPTPVATNNAMSPAPDTATAPNAVVAPNDGPPPPTASAPAEPSRPAGKPVPPHPETASPAIAAAPRATATAPAARPVPVVLRGEIRSIEPIRERPPGTGAGAVVGGVLGGVVGNQFGHGTGRAAMTVLGAAGGAVAGNNVERNMNKRIVGYRVSVRLDNGQMRTYEESHLNGLHVGDRVHVEGKHLRRA
jgi:outer membrane lipoprotein SlyB